MSSDAIEGELSHLTNPIFSSSMPTLDVSSEPISKPILDPDDSSYDLSPKSHDDLRNPLRQPKHRSHEDHKDDQEEQRQWLEYIKNSYAVAKEWMDKDEILWVGSKFNLDPNSELKSVSLINMTHPSLEEALDEINLRVTNPRVILDNKTSNEYHKHGMMEAKFSPMDIHEETPLELEKEDDIDEHGSYFMNTSSNPCSHEKSSESIDLSNIVTHKIFNHLILSAAKIFEKVVVDAYVYHKYCKSHCENLEIGT
jgi:hypothetical protein